MEVRRLFDDLEIDWQRLGLPARCRSLAREEVIEPAPSLQSIAPEHLRSVRSLLSLYSRAVALGVVSDCERDRIAFLSTAAYCLRVGERPAALLAYLLKRGELPATLQDEDRACSALRRHLAKERGGGWLKARKPAMPERE